MTTRTPRALAAALVREHGETFAQRAGIDLGDEPGPLWQLFVLAQLMSARIRADVAVASAREVFDAGWTTPASLRTSSWQQRVDALGRGGYRRYDFSTSTRLGANAAFVRERWDDDLRGLRDEAGSEPRRIVTLLQEFDGIGPAGAGIFVREVASTWTLSEPFADRLTRKGAALAGLGSAAKNGEADHTVTAGQIFDGVDHRWHAALGAALVRVARTPSVLDDLES